MKNLNKNSLKFNNNCKNMKYLQKIQILFSYRTIITILKILKDHKISKKGLFYKKKLFTYFNNISQTKIHKIN